MNVIVIALIAIGGFALLITFVFIYLNRTKGSGKKYPFLLYNKDGSAARKIEARIKIDPENRSRKVFVFEQYDDKIEIKEPTIWIDGVGYREVKIGVRGGLVLLKPHVVENDEYIKTAMDAEEVTVLTSTIIENNREFENPMAKTTALMVISMAIIAFLIIVGCVYAAITMVNGVKDMVEIAQENTIATANINAAATTNAEVTAQLSQITSILLGENVTRRLE